MIKIYIFRAPTFETLLFLRFQFRVFPGFRERNH